MARKYKERDRLQELKEKVQDWHQYWNRNIKTYNKFNKYVFWTTLSDSATTVLSELGKPAIEFNILEATISKARGDFKKHEPAVTVRAADGVTVEDLDEKFLKQMDVTECHLKEILHNSSNDSLEYNLFSDTAAGGYSAAKVSTDYVNSLSFDQVIKVERVYDPTLIGFDPIAKDSHKGDGEHCFELYPMKAEEFEREYGEEYKFRKTSNIEGFQWSYSSQKEDVVLICDFYYKEKKKKKIVKLSNGHTVVKEHYQQFLKLWHDEGFVEQAPIVISERWSTIEMIKRCVFCENKILSEEETSFSMLPIVFIDGNSRYIKEGDGGATYQATRPLVFNAKGAQDLLNFAGQTIAAEIEDMPRHQYMMPVEAVPEGLEDAYKKPQQLGNLLYNQFYKDDPTVRLDPPREIMKPQTPQVVENTFGTIPKLAQMIIGTYDSVLATNDKQISGVAIQQGALQTSAAISPYFINFVKGQERICQIIVDLIPKYYVTPRSIPIRKKDGKRAYQLINHPKNPESIDLLYNPNNFQIKVEVGVSEGVQKQVALEQIIRMMQASQEFNEFINTMGLETIIDNLDIRGQDHMKAQAAVFMQQKAEQAQAAQGKPSPEEIQMQTYEKVEMAKTEQQAMKTQGDQAIAAAKLANEKQLTEIKFLETMAKVEEMGAKLNIEQEKIASENSRTGVELALEIASKMNEHAQINIKE